MTKEIKDIHIPIDVKKLMKAFCLFGYEIYIVGGCVRDSILNKSINDWDLCTEAIPNQIIDVCKEFEFKYILTGLKHGTVTVVLNNESYEITTFREDGIYSDGRHPDKVEFTSSLKSDLARRDFTINAMAYNEEVGLIDYFGGIQDIKNKLIRCVGDPEQRFKEDNLRRLRAIRFACELGFEIEEKTNNMLSMNSENISKLSIERIRVEFCKILTSGNAVMGLKQLYKLNILKHIIPELIASVDFDQHNIHHDKDVFSHTLFAIQNSKPNLITRLSILLHDIAKPYCFTMDENGQGHFINHDVLGEKMSREILGRLKFDSNTIDKVCILVRNHMIRYDGIELQGIKRLINRVGVENLDDFFELQIADNKASAEYYWNFDEIENIKEKCNKILAEKQPIAIKDLKVNGNDLMEVGFKPGKEIGIALNHLLDEVIKNPELNTKEQLLKLLTNTQV